MTEQYIAARDRIRAALAARKPCREAVSRLLMLAMLSLITACASQFNVRPLPEFVTTAIEPGDTVIVTTTSGQTVEFDVTEVTGKALHGGDRIIPLGQIAELKKVARSRPPSPCGGKKELGCSVPLLVSLASKNHAHYRDAFYDACEQHDYCYRHGARTYGWKREHCDTEFLANMKASCPRRQQSTLATIIGLIGDDVKSSFTCLDIANDFYVAARDFGEKHFRDADGTYCEYDGRPQIIFAPVN